MKLSDPASPDRASQPPLLLAPIGATGLFPAPTNRRGAPFRRPVPRRVVVQPSAAITGAHLHSCPCPIIHGGSHGIENRTQCLPQPVRTVQAQPTTLHHQANIQSIKHGRPPGLTNRS